jgi:hypothetical protein
MPFDEKSFLINTLLGFRIGPGNQAYMFDTLPKTIENIKDVKPGDLVFIQAVYYNPKSKRTSPF